MKRLTISKTIAAAGTAAAMAWTGQAFAIEPGSFLPHAPGVSAGVPAGALPPPGFYFANTLFYNDASLQNDSANPVVAAAHANVIAWSDVPSIIWATPLRILGAQTAIAIAQPFTTLGASSAANGNQSKTGLFNTIINPIISKQLPMGFFVSASFPIYFQDGDTGDRGKGAASGQEHLANNTTTFAPSLAVAWFNGHGLETSLNLEYDIQTQDTNAGVGVPGSKFQSGDVLNLDFGVIQVLPGAYKKWSLGVVGFYTVQTTDDQITIGGVTTTFGPIPGVVGTGNRTEKFGLGPSVGYNFGPVDMRLWYTRDLYVKNSFKGDTFFFSFGIPL